MERFPSVISLILDADYCKTAPRPWDYVHNWNDHGMMDASGNFRADIQPKVEKVAELKISNKVVL